MKKLLILSIVVFTLFSCSSDDKNLDPIIGKWQLNAETRNGVSTIANECEKMSTIEFFSNSNITIISFYQDMNGDCISNNDDTIRAQWRNDGNNTYTLIENDGTENSSTINFTNSNNTYYTERITSDNNGQSDTLRTTYIRL